MSMLSLSRALCFLGVWGALFIPLTADASCGCCGSDWLCRYQRVAVSPEFYYVDRTRDGGTKQTGWMYGVRALYERLKPWGFYWGVEGEYGAGTLKGHSGLGDILKSKFEDATIEGRAGFTFQARSLWFQPTLTPYGGYGYFSERNAYRAPSPMDFVYRNYYQYIAFGVLSTFTITEEWLTGVNFKGRMPWHTRSRVTNDPDGPITLQVADELNYRIEVPVLYQWLFCSQTLQVGLVPFYEFRHYGGRQNVPFDFFETKLRIYGFDIQLAYKF